jgi:hypothetical protein
MGRIIPYMMEKYNMSETTNQIMFSTTLLARKLVALMRLCAQIPV